jgi:hypothetical protein
VTYLSVLLSFIFSPTESFCLFWATNESVTCRERGQRRRLRGASRSVEHDRVNWRFKICAYSLLYDTRKRLPPPNWICRSGTGGVMSSSSAFIRANKPGIVSAWRLLITTDVQHRISVSAVTRVRRITRTASSAVQEAAVNIHPPLASLLPN